MTGAGLGRVHTQRVVLFSRADLTRVHRRLLAHLGIRRVEVALGGSLGGMQALQWALDHLGEVGQAALICAAGGARRASARETQTTPASNAL